MPTIVVFTIGSSTSKPAQCPAPDSSAPVMGKMILFALRGRPTSMVGAGMGPGVRVGECEYSWTVASKTTLAKR